LVTPAIGASTTGARGVKDPIRNGNMTGKRYRHGVPEPTDDVTAADPIVISRCFDELTTHELHDLIRLRIDVFVVEQACPYPELDGRDVEVGTEHHWIAGERLTVACYARTLVDPGGVVRIGRVVTAPGARGRGLAASLMGSLVDRYGDAPLALDAQSHLAGWYAAFGFTPAGLEFVEDGIPHLPMRR
jgi:ElaA protein